MVDEVAEERLIDVLDPSEDVGCPPPPATAEDIWDEDPNEGFNGDSDLLLLVLLFAGEVRAVAVALLLPPHFGRIVSR